MIKADIKRLLSIAIMKINNHKAILVVLLILGITLRIIWLGKIPSGFFRDEAALGYNAYSIWKTGGDEFGMKFPLVFRSFEVFFLPAYAYISAPIVGLLGLSEFSTRLLSSLVGISALIFIYLIAKEIWNKKVVLFALLVLVISPWHIFYSRGTFEGNLALTFFTAGFFFWIKFLKLKTGKTFLISIFLFALSMYSYQAERLVVPLFAVVAILLSLPILIKLRNKLVIPTLIVFVFLIPLLSLSFKSGGYHRAFGVSVFSQEKTPPGWVEGKEAGILTNNIFYLRGRQIASLYLSYFSPRNLFVEGDFDKQRSVENMSVFYVWMAPAMLIGVWFAIKSKLKSQKLLLAWMVLGPLPAALTGDPFHTYRSLLFYMPLAIFAGVGLSRVYRLIRSFGLVLLVVGSLALFSFNYFIITPATRARAWDYGYKDIVEFVNSLPKGTKVVIDDPWTESYIHFLFLNKVDPTFYQVEVGKLGSVGVYYYTNSDKIRPNKFGDFEFRPVDWPTERGNEGVIFVMTVDRLPVSEFKGDPKVKLLKEIYYPDKSVAYRIVQIK